MRRLRKSMYTSLTTRMYRFRETAAPHRCIHCTVPVLVPRTIRYATLPEDYTADTTWITWRGASRQRHEWKHRGPSTRAGATPPSLGLAALRFPTVPLCFPSRGHSAGRRAPSRAPEDASLPSPLVRAVIRAGGLAGEWHRSSHRHGAASCVCWRRPCSTHDPWHDRGCLSTTSPSS